MVIVATGLGFECSRRSRTEYKYMSVLHVDQAFWLPTPSSTNGYGGGEGHPCIGATWDIRTLVQKVSRILMIPSGVVSCFLNVCVSERSSCLAKLLAIHFSTPISVQLSFTSEGLQDYIRGQLTRPISQMVSLRVLLFCDE